MRTVVPRASPESHEDLARQQVQHLSDLISGTPLEVAGVKLTLGLPTAGWLPFEMSSGVQTVSAEFSDVLDPFRAWPSESDHESGFVGWLLRIAQGENPALAIECEGPWFVAVVRSLDQSRIRVTASGDGTPSFDIAVDRKSFVRDVYGQLLQFWESAAFKERWSDWGAKGEPYWSVRSAPLEDAIG